MKKTILITALIISTQFMVPVEAGTWDKSDEKFLHIAELRIDPKTDPNAPFSCWYLSTYIKYYFKERNKTLDPNDKAFLVLLESCVKAARNK